MSKSKIFVILSNDPFSGIFLSQISRFQQVEISQVFYEKGRRNQKSSFSVFCDVCSQSGIRYALYQGLEVSLYTFLIVVLKVLGLSKVFLPMAICKDKSIPCLPFTKDNVEACYEQSECDYILCVRGSQILKKEILHLPKKACINFHASLLPKYAGLGTIFQMMKSNEKYMGGTFHSMVEKVDAGDILSSFSFEIDKKRSVSYHQLLAYSIAPKYLVEAIENFENNTKLPIEGQREYYSFPKKSDVKDFKGKLMQFRDIICFVSILLNDERSTEE